jgi:hypothetical protein
MNTNIKILKIALRTNAVFSFLCAVLILFFTSQIADLLGKVPIYMLISLAIALIGFVVMILYVSEKQKLSVKQAKIITIMDFSWVIGSIILVSLGSQWFSITGIIVILVVAAIVGMLALFQYLGIKRTIF